MSEGVFTTTHWTVVITAARRELHHADEALEQLCRSYWSPIYVFLRRSGWGSHDAEDLTQAFFERVLQKDYLRAVDRSKGKFRSFLLAMLRHFLANYRRDAQAQKRGGGVGFVCIDDESVDEKHLESSRRETCPERAFDRQWATTLLDKVLKTLQREYEQAGKAEVFSALRIFLTGEKSTATYLELAQRLNTTEAAIKMAVSRMRRRYGELLRAEITRTVTNDAEAEEELRALFAALT